MSYHQNVTSQISRMIPWDSGELRRITRLVLRPTDHMRGGSPRYYRVVYCHGNTWDDEYVRVFLPFDVLRAHQWKIEVVDHAKEAGVHAKNLGLFDAVLIKKALIV